MLNTPKALARTNIDDLLRAAGWQIQSPDELNLGAAHGVAMREFSLKTGFADYLLFVERMAIGAVEAKAEGTPLSDIESQSEKYSAGLPAIPPRGASRCPSSTKALARLAATPALKNWKRPLPPTSHAPSGCASPSSSARSRASWWCRIWAYIH